MQGNLQHHRQVGCKMSNTHLQVLEARFSSFGLVRNQEKEPEIKSRLEVSDRVGHNYLPTDSA